MTAQRIPYRARTLVLALQAALAVIAMAGAGAARADEEGDVAALVKPTNTVEVGVGVNSDKSAKFGEYNGLHRKGPDLIGNLSVRGGDAWGQGTGTRWWNIYGTDLGTDSRYLKGEYGDQGRWNFGVEYDSLSHRFTDTYQTPLSGTNGGNAFIMPRGFGVVSNQTGANPSGTQALTPTQKSFFHTQDVHSDRNTTTLSGGYDFNERWNARVSWGHVQQSGAKLMSSGTDPNVLPSGATFAGYKPGAESIQLIMNPTSYTTDNVTAELNWVGERAFMTTTATYSHFVDNTSTVSFSNPFTSANVPNGTLLGGGNTDFPINQLSTMPGNTLMQLGANGGYNFSRATRLVGGLSVASTKQDDPYVNQNQMQPGGLPQNSLNGNVRTTHADLRLTDRSIKQLTLGGAYKYDERDNRTGSATYSFLDIGGAKETSVNTPMSYRHQQFEVTGDYAFATAQNLHVALGRDEMHRWCRNDLANNARGSLSATNAGYYTTASCAQVPDSSENKLSATYRMQATEDVRFRLTGNYGDRSSTVNPSFYNPMQANNQGFENFGYLAFFQASRRETGGKATVDWQANKALDLSLTGSIASDDYKDSALGVQTGKSNSLSLDANYAFSPATTATAYTTWQHRSRDLLTANGRNAVAPLATTWTNSLSDDTTSVGVSVKDHSFVHGKLELRGDLAYSLGVTGQSTSLNYASASCNTPSTTGFVCGALPDIRSKMVQLNFSGTYQIDKNSAFLMGLLFQKLNADDYLYNFYQMGFTGQTTMPTNQQTPSYTQYRVMVGYRYSFQ
jgi:MtrB/PioB family decaheme-associated outer membrane protein